MKKLIKMRVTASKIKFKLQKLLTKCKILKKDNSIFSKRQCRNRIKHAIKKVILF